LWVIQIYVQQKQHGGRPPFLKGKIKVKSQNFCSRLADFDKMWQDGALSFWTQQEGKPFNF